MCECGECFTSLPAGIGVVVVVVWLLFLQDSALLFTVLFKISFKI